MSAKSSNPDAPAATPPRPRRRWWLIAGLPLWVLVGFYAAQVVIVLIIKALQLAGVSFTGIDMAVLDAVVSAIVYLLTLAIVIGVPWAMRRRTSRSDLGLTRLPRWMDIGLAPAGFVIYLIASGSVVALAAHIFPQFNADQSQQVGFSNLSHGYEYVLAFVTLVVVAPLAEETLFRGYLYGKLRRAVPLWVAMLVTSAVFGAVHGQWNVGLDVFVLSLVMCGLREVTGNIWAGMLVHMIKNGLAFYLLFINPTLLHTIGG